VDDPAIAATDATTTETDILDGTVADVAEMVASMTDVHALQSLRTQETHGKNRIGALEAIDARIAALKE
jgi:hypothetical protein